MKIYFFIFLYFFSSFVYCDIKYIYISNNGSGTVCNQTFPCSSIQDGFNVITINTTEVYFKVESGIYTGDKNINVNFPSSVYKYSIDSLRTNSESVIFDCENNFINAFNISQIFTFTRITIQNCDYGINYNNNATYNTLSIINCNINNCITSINAIIGDKITIANTNINNSIGSNCMNSIASICITNTNPSASDSLYSHIDSSLYNSSSIIISLLGISHTIYMDNNYFSNINADSIISTNNIDSITIENSVFENSTCNTSIYSTSTTGDFEISNSNFSTCNTAISGIFEKTVTIDSCILTDIPQSLLISTPSTCTITFSQINNSPNPGNFSCGNYNLKSSSLFYSGSLYLTQTSAIKSALTNCEFTYSTGKPVYVYNGNWDVTVNITNPISSTTNGGAMSFISTSSNNQISFSGCFITNASSNGFGGGIYTSNYKLIMEYCTFTNCSASYGGGAYLSGFPTLTLQASSSSPNIFENNIANEYGGGLYLNSQSVSDSLQVGISYSNFISNTAQNGAAIACCVTTESSDTCDFEIVLENSDLTSNINLLENGEDVTCDVSINARLVVFCILIAVLIICIICCIITIIAIIYKKIYKKTKEYETIQEK